MRTVVVTAVSSFVVKLSLPATGGSFTALTVIVRVSLSVSVPPVPVLPRSLVSIVSVTLPLKLADGLNVIPVACASVALI